MKFILKSMEILETLFKSMLRSYSLKDNRISDYWSEISDHYKEPHRHYHTLTHLNHFLKELTNVRTQLKNQQAIFFALYYHDIIYDPLRSDNEESSALLAKERMMQMGVPGPTVDLTVNYIIATRTHAVKEDSDANYFTDADLSVLGQQPENYKDYSNAIRAEYDIYPDIVYWPARKKVLCGFLQMSRIFKTGFFYKKYEEQARVNIAAEISSIDRNIMPG